MPPKKYGKLVRDDVPAEIENRGEYPVTRTLSDEEFERELIRKGHEEWKGFAKARTREELVDEGADLLEVMCAALLRNNISFQEVVHRMRQKRRARGGFARQIFLVDVLDAPPEDRAANGPTE